MSGLSLRLNSPSPALESPKMGRLPLTTIIWPGQDDGQVTEWLVKNLAGHSHSCQQVALEDETFTALKKV